jgi:transcriptional regulator with XRE-family HTH domain
MNIGSNIRKLRLSVGITQKQLAEKIGVSQTHIAKWKKATGESMPTGCLKLPWLLDAGLKIL